MGALADIAGGYAALTVAPAGMEVTTVEYKINLLRKVTLEIFVNEDFLERTVETITSISKTGSEGCVGDGKIFVLPVLDAITIDDELRGPGAI